VTDRLKRIRVRAWRRGIQEMDLLLGPYADALSAGRATCDLDALEALMLENDVDLYAWVSGAAEAPSVHAPAIAALRRFHGIADGSSQFSLTGPAR